MDTIIAIGKSNQNIPKNVWLCVLKFFKRMKYSRSGIMLPITSPVKE